MSLKEMYQYIYYKIYKVMNIEDFDWMADFRASLFMAIFEVMTIVSVLAYFSYITNIELSDNLSLMIFIGLFLPIGILHHKYFHDHERRETFVAKFDEWHLWKNVVGTFIVLAVLALAVINLFYAIGLYKSKFLY